MATLDLISGHAGAATHALVIGVGAYRHLEGGNQPVDNQWGLRQLPGASISAKRFVDWLRQSFHHPDAPLATIEHLITGPEGIALGSDEPTMAAIRNKFFRWKQRASANPENIAIFYFSGHGVLKGTETGLLAADFAEPEVASLMHNAIHVEETVQGMFSCQANRQCFIIDACRTTEEPLLGKMTRPGEALATASEDEVRDIPQPVLFASGLNQASYQLGNIVSPFTKALIESLDAMGADDNGGGYAPGQCAVDTSSLLKGIKASMVLDRRKRPFLKKQDATAGGGGTFILHYPQEQIRVPFVVGCHPAALNEQATILIRRKGVELHRQIRAESDLESLVVPDAYEVAAELPGRLARKQVLVTPPFREGRLQDFQPAAPPPGK
jgi:hypothetical protein